MPFNPLMFPQQKLPQIKKVPPWLTKIYEFSLIVSLECDKNLYLAAIPTVIEMMKIRLIRMRKVTAIALQQYVPHLHSSGLRIQSLKASVSDNARCIVKTFLSISSCSRIITGRHRAMLEFVAFNIDLKSSTIKSNWWLFFSWLLAFLSSLPMDVIIEVLTEH
jgi:hypothetical protein